MCEKRKHKTELGDFQTPREFADRICAFLAGQGTRPISVLEPTCGRGNFLLAALEHFPSIVKAIGVDINKEHIDYIEDKLKTLNNKANRRVRVFQGDFFVLDWKEIIETMPKPLLVVGNPPWVTSSELSRLGSKNLPEKTNLRNFSGIDAITGKSNFDISEWMLIHILKWLEGCNAMMAMLCKTTVARKVLHYIWEAGLQLEHSSIYRFDAKKVFGASVDGCLLVCQTTASGQSCRVYSDISESTYETTFGFRDHHLIAEVGLYDRWKHLQGEEHYRWRSGVKHDCSTVMELEKEEEGFRNKLGELYELEEIYLYPLLKSSDIAGQNSSEPKRWMLVTQRSVGEDTAPIRKLAPKTWAYLEKHASLLDRRKSSVYRDHPRFSIFGVGDYTFSPWKVAISGLYKRLHFVAIGSHGEKPIVLDDTCYFIPCRSEAEANYLASLLNSEIAKQFFRAYIFWDKKRPITANILGRLDLVALAKELGTESKIRGFLSTKPSVDDPTSNHIHMAERGAKSVVQIEFTAGVGEIPVFRLK